MHNYLKCHIFTGAFSVCICINISKFAIQLDKNRTGQISTEYAQYSKGTKIGNGGFGRVYELKYTTGLNSAVKAVAVKEENLVNKWTMYKNCVCI